LEEMVSIIKKKLKKIKNW